MSLSGLVSLKKKVLCKREALGNVYPALIGGINVNVWFPAYVERQEEDPMKRVSFSNPLAPPSLAQKWTRGKEPLSWGHVMAYPSGDSLVELFALSVEHDIGNDEIAQTIYNDFTRWEEAFINYCILCTKQGVSRDKNLRRQNVNVELMNEKGYVGNCSGQALYVVIPSRSEYVTKKQIEDALVCIADLETFSNS